MRCTSCTRTVLPVVAVDIDGTLGDYHGHFLAFAEDYLGRMTSDTYAGQMGFKHWFCEAYQVGERTWNDIKLAYRQGGMKRSMRAYQGAHDLLVALETAGCEVWLCTTRPYLRLDNVDPDTRAWLARHDMRYDHLIYGDDKYFQLAKQVDRERVVAVVDDLPEMLEQAAAAFHWKVPMWRRTPWNQAMAHGTGYETLMEITEEAVHRVTRWRHDHEEAS